MCPNDFVPVVPSSSGLRSTQLSPTSVTGVFTQVAFSMTTPPATYFKAFPLVLLLLLMTLLGMPLQPSVLTVLGVSILRASVKLVLEFLTPLALTVAPFRSPNRRLTFQLKIPYPLPLDSTQPRSTVLLAAQLASAVSWVTTLFRLSWLPTCPSSILTVWTIPQMTVTLVLLSTFSRSFSFSGLIFL